MRRLILIILPLLINSQAYFNQFKEYCDAYDQMVADCLAANRNQKSTPINQTQFVTATDSFLRSKRALIVDPSMIQQDIRKKWKDAYVKPITYMLVVNQNSENILNNINNFRDIVYKAFKVWSSQTQLRFTEVAHENVAEIKIEFKDVDVSHYPNLSETQCPSFKRATGREQTSGKNLDQSQLVLAHGNFPYDSQDGEDYQRYQDTPAGDLHFNAEVNWDYNDNLASSQNQNLDDQLYNIFSVTLHEIGHTLGLVHNFGCQDAVMYMSYTV